MMTNKSLKEVITECVQTIDKLTEKITARVDRD